jgi:hypothetical protein
MAWPGQDFCEPCEAAAVQGGILFASSNCGTVGQWDNPIAGKGGCRGS